MTHKQLFLFLLLAFPGHFAIAEESIERITVESNETAPSLNKQLLDRDVIASSAATLTELIASLPSVQIRKIGGLGNPTAISIRGSTSQQVNLRIDGQLINTSQSGSFDLDQIPVSLIESIEVSQFQSDSTGPTPIGGEIRINTLKSDGPSRSAALTLGSFGLQEINIRQGINLDSHRFIASLNHLQSDNDYSYLVPQSYTDSQVSVSEPLRNNHFKKTTLFLADEFGSEASTIRINAQVNAQEKAQPNYQNNTPEMASILENNNYRLGLEHAWLHPIDDTELALNFDGYWFARNETYIDAPNASRNDEYQYDTEQVYLQLKAPWRYRSMQLLPYINLNLQSFESESLVNDQRPSCNGIQTCDVEATQALLNLGARLNWQPEKSSPGYGLLYNRLFAENSNGLKYQIDDKTLETEFDYGSAEFDVNYRIDRHRLSLHLAQGIRIPTLSELFGNRGAFKGNDALKAEESRSITLNAQSLWPQLSLQNSLYYQDVDNTIVAIFNSRGIGQYENVSASTIWGLSTSARYNVTPGLTVTANMDLLDSNTESRFFAFDNKQLPGVYHKQFQLRVSYDLDPNWQLSVTHNLDRDLYFDRANKISSHSHFNTERNTTGVSIAWQYAEYAASININNLFDTAYYDLANRPAEGRNIQLKFIIKEF